MDSTRRSRTSRSRTSRSKSKSKSRSKSKTRLCGICSRTPNFPVDCPFCHKTKFVLAKEGFFLKEGELEMKKLVISSKMQKLLQAVAKHATDSRGRVDEHKVLCFYPLPPKRKLFCLTINDLKRLLPDAWLNDELINFYVQYLGEEKFSDLEESLVVNSTTFYLSFTSYLNRLKSGCIIKESRLGFRAKEDIFDKEFIIIPFNQAGNHWVVLFVCYPCRLKENLEYLYSDMDCTSEASSSGAPTSAVFKDMKDSMKSVKNKNGPCLLLFDSLTGVDAALKLNYDIPSDQRNNIICANIKRYIAYEYKRFHEVTIDLTNLPEYYVYCPQQANLSDCGVFALQFIEKFLENPDIFQGFPPDLRFWFDPEVIAEKRLELLELFFSFVEKQKEM